MKIRGRKDGSLESIFVASLLHSFPPLAPQKLREPRGGCVRVFTPGAVWLHVMPQPGLAVPMVRVT